MKKETFTEEELQEAAHQAAKAMLDALPEEPEYEQAPSREFRERMERLMGQAEARRRRRQMLRSTAAVFALVFIGISAWLSVDTGARAAAQKWIELANRQYAIYQSDTPRIEGDVGHYELGWVPQGYYAASRLDGVREDESEPVRTRGVFYFNLETRDVISFHYGILDELTTVSLPVGHSVYTCTKVVVNETIMDLYTSDKEYANSYLIWLDEEKDVYFYIKALAEQSVMLHMAESVVLVETPKVD